MIVNKILIESKLKNSTFINLLKREGVESMKRYIIQLVEEIEEKDISKLKLIANFIKGLLGKN